VAAADGVGGFEGGEFVRELPEGTAEPVVGGVVGGVLDGVATDYGRVAVGVVGGVGGEVDFAEETLLVVFEFADHASGLGGGECSGEKIGE